MTTKRQNKIINVLIVSFIAWWTVMMFQMQSKAHDMEMAQLEIALQDAENMAEAYKYELIETRIRMNIPEVE